MLAVTGAYHGSLGAWLDAFGLVRGQIELVFSAQEQMRMQTRLLLLTEDGHPVRLADGRRLAADRAVDDSTRYRLVHLPGFRVGSPQDLESRLLAARGLLDWLRWQHAAGALVSASGAAILLLAEAGLLDGIAAPLPRALLQLARERYPRLRIDEQRAVVEQDNIILGSGLAGDAALMVRLVERTLSLEMGRWLASVIGADRGGARTLAGDPLVGRAQLWLERNFTQEVRIAELARTLATPHQTLIRRFKRALAMTPKHYVQHLRVQAAQRMLLQTSRPIDQVANLVGYRDARSFRTVFQQHVGVTASAYRADAGGMKAPQAASSVSVG